MSKYNVYVEDVSLEAVFNKLGGVEGARRFLSGVVEIAVKVISFITQTFTVMVDETLALADAIAEAKFDWVNENITEKNFPKPKGGTKSSREIAIFHFGKTMSSEDVIAKMDAEGYRPATIWELLAFARDNPDLQRQFPIVALGSVGVVGGDRSVACFDRGGSRRDLTLDWFVGGWRGDCRFLAVRKSSES